MLRFKWFWFSLILLLIAQPVLAHDIYTGWINNEHKGCCNNQDCKSIPEAWERVTNGILEIYVQGVGVAKGQFEWCPVLKKHYLSSGNVPNASVSHYCISDFYGATTPCSQFICYQPKPLI